MNIVILGANGFIGKQLASTLLQTTDHQITLFSRSAKAIPFDNTYASRITKINGNILSKKDIRRALNNADVAVYLVHLMGDGVVNQNFQDAERTAAINFGNAVKRAGIERVIYVGGMGKKHTTLTKHLKSRQMTGELIRERAPLLIELRTPMVIGKGSAGYDVLRALVSKSPVIFVPNWARAATQPITVNDVVRYIVASLTLPVSKHQIIEIGGPERLSYIQVAKRYAHWQHKRLLVISIPFVPKSLAASVIRIFKRNKSAAIASDMIESAAYPMIVENRKADALFKSIHPKPIETAFSK